MPSYTRTRTREQAQEELNLLREENRDDKSSLGRARYLKNGP